VKERRAPKPSSKTRPPKTALAEALSALEKKIAAAPLVEAAKTTDATCAPLDEREVFREAVAGARPIRAPKSRRIPPPTTAADRSKTEDREPLPSFDVERDADGHVGAVRAGAPRHVLDALRQASIGRDATLDLHGMRAADTAASVEGFVRKMRRAGVTRILIVHGKGLHSDGRFGVLREVTIDALTEGRTARLVLAFVTARASLGGAGALAVALA
jgi:DNA-nicking Smr family endonuclease